MINVSTFDRFTLAHAAAGAGMRAVGLPAWAAFLLAVGWELVEDVLKDAKPGLFPHATHDSKQNALGDVLALMAGWWGADRIARRSAG